MHEPPEPPLSGDDDPSDSNDARDAHDEKPSGAPPHPMDRVWRHPSEVGRRRRGRPGRAQRVTGARRRSPARSPRRWPAGIAVAAAGSAFTLVVLAATGTLGGGTRTVVESPSGDGSNDGALMRVVPPVQRSVVTVVARDATGSRRGSGICVRHDGEILTSAWLVGSASSVTVTDSNGATVAARVVGRDTVSGIALLRAGRDMTAAQLAPRIPRTGDPALVIGGGQYVNSGIVTSDDAWRFDPNGVTMRELLGTNTNGQDGIGAALVDGSGRVTGMMVTADGLAVPVTYAGRVADELRRAQRVIHGWMGISGIDRNGRAVVTKVDPRSPAAAAGLRAADAITAIDGRTILGMPELVTAVRTRWPGDGIDVEVQRGGAPPMTLRVVLSGPPTPGAQPPAKGATRRA